MRLHISVHREDTVGNYKAVTLGLSLLQATLQIGHVCIRIQIDVAALADSQQPSTNPFCVLCAGLMVIILCQLAFRDEIVLPNV